ncbi:MAG: hypothetical protein ACK4E0_18070 [Chitinophagaceae bacterium]
MRNVLIPTDFSVDSLHWVEQTLQALDDQPISINLFHAFDMNISAPDVLGQSRRVPYAHLLTDEFRQACKRLKDKYPKILKGIQLRHMYGNTANLFRNFIDAHDIDLIVAPKYFRWQPVAPGSIDPSGFFAKAGIPVLSELPRKRKVMHTAAPLAETVAVLIN